MLGFGRARHKPSMRSGHEKRRRVRRQCSPYWLESSCLWFLRRKTRQYVGMVRQIFRSDGNSAFKDRRQVLREREEFMEGQRHMFCFCGTVSQLGSSGYFEAEQ